MKQIFRRHPYIFVPALALAVVGLVLLFNLVGVVSVSWKFLALALALTTGVLLAGICIAVRTLRDALNGLPTQDNIRVDDACAFSDSLNRVFAAIETSRKHLYEDYEVKDIQLKILMNQINPHFLYNTLESIRGQALYNDDLVVADMAETLSIFFRYCISQKDTIVRLEDEIRSVNIYLKIMKFRLPEKFEFTISVENPNCLEYQIPKLTLQPIIENTILHGLSDFKTGGLISVRILETDALLKIYIRDNGCGIAPQKLKEINQKLEQSSEQSSKAGGIALYNINRRIKLTYGAQYGLRIYSTEGTGTSVSVYLPKRPLEK